MQYQYKIFGLNILSEFFLFNSPFQSSNLHDVYIGYGDVPEKIENVIVKGARYQASPNEFLLNVDGIARYYVTGGDKILVWKYPGAIDKDVMVFLTGSAFGALLHQRLLTPFHGSAVKINDGGYIFLGKSGAGKSTLAAALNTKGYPLLADDICIVRLNSKETNIVPGIHRLKLWQDTLLSLGINVDKLDKVRENSNIKKYFFPSSSVYTKPLKLNGIFLLNLDNSNEINFEEVKGQKKVELLLNNIYQNRVVGNSEDKTAIFNQCLKIANTTSITRINRSQDYSTWAC